MEYIKKSANEADAFLIFMDDEGGFSSACLKAGWRDTGVFGANATWLENPSRRVIMGYE
jgi:hypothetical protein